MTELFRELEQFRMLAFGVGMVAIMVWRPRVSSQKENQRFRLKITGRNMTSSVLSVDSLSMVFGGLVAVDDVSLDVGEV